MNVQYTGLFKNNEEYLTTQQLGVLENAFKKWQDSAVRKNVVLSRKKVLLIFLLIRYTGAKLNEVLALDCSCDIDFKNNKIIFLNRGPKSESSTRKVAISKELSGSIHDIINSFDKDEKKDILSIDPGFVRKKFYERGKECQFPKKLVGPEMIRKARGAELLEKNMPFPAVQMMLGHNNSNMTASYVSFSQDDIFEVSKKFMEKESAQQSSARNSFFGKIKSIHHGDIQSLIEITAINGFEVKAIITNTSISRLLLKPGKFVAAEIKAPMVMLDKSENYPVLSAENIFQGIIRKINRGKVNSECIVDICDSAQLCALVSTERMDALNILENDSIWAFFNSYAVIIQA